MYARLGMIALAGVLGALSVWMIPVPACPPPPPEKVWSDRELIEELWQRYADYRFGFYALGIYVALSQLWVLYKSLRWFFRATKKYAKVVWHDAATVIGSVAPVYVPEKYVQGSDYYPQTTPGFAVELYREARAGLWEFVGMGWRLQEYLVTAHHVVAGDDTIRVKAGDKHVDVDPSRFEPRGADLAVLLLPGVDWATLAVKSARVPKMALSAGTVVFAHCRGVSSSGMLSPHTVLPYVIYQGSTKPGFSGSPLFVGSTVFGMHVGAGKVNLALDSNWIQAIAFRPEDSNDWVYQEIENMVKRSGKKMPYHMYTPGEAYVLTGGRYHVLDVEDIPDHIRDLLEYESPMANYARENRSYPPTFEFNDVESVKVEEPRHLNLKGASVLAEARRLKAGETVQSNSSVEVIVPSDSQKLDVTGMRGLESTVAQLSKALGDTLISLKESQSSAPTGQRSRRRKPKLSHDLKV